MQAIVAGGAVEAVAVADPDPECAAQAANLAPGAAVLPSLEALLDHGLDGLVIATPSALHAEQAIAALNRGIAVFCQKPLGRNDGEARRVIEAVRLACSWHLHAGRDAAIEADFHGTQGSVSIRNVGGSFYDFEAHRHRGTSTERLAAPPDDWGGRAAAAWAERLAQDPSFDPDALQLAKVSAVLDRIYAGG